MKKFALATVFAVAAGSASANVPTMTLPDLTFPAPSTVTSSQNCVTSVTSSCAPAR